PVPAVRLRLCGWGAPDPTRSAPARVVDSYGQTTLVTVPPVGESDTGTERYPLAVAELWSPPNAAAIAPSPSATAVLSLPAYAAADESLPTAVDLLSPPSVALAAAPAPLATAMLAPPPELALLVHIVLPRARTSAP